MMRGAMPSGRSMEGREAPAVRCRRKESKETSPPLLLLLHQQVLLALLPPVRSAAVASVGGSGERLSVGADR